jgi:glycine betaine/choline ABC-type transport system substrate-binding protein
MIKKLCAAILCSIIFLSIAGCSKTEKKIVLASKPMTEQYVITEILRQLIEKETDIKVELKPGIGGGTANIHPAIVSGEIDMYPEYTGTGWLLVLKEEPIYDPQKLYEAVKKAYDETYNIHWSGLYGFNDTYGVAVKKSLADRYGLKTYSDLAKVSGEVTFGANYDFYEREDGFPGLEKAYGFSFKNKVELDIGLKYEAINSGQVDAINVFSTDGRLRQEGLVVLEDDKNFFPSYYAATLVRNETLDKYPELDEVLEKLNGKISNDEMIEMNYLVEIEKMDPGTVATDFLKKEGL